MLCKGHTTEIHRSFSHLLFSSTFLSCAWTIRSFHLCCLKKGVIRKQKNACSFESPKSRSLGNWKGFVVQIKDLRALWWGKVISVWETLPLAMGRKERINILKDSEEGAWVHLGKVSGRSKTLVTLVSHSSLPWIGNYYMICAATCKLGKCLHPSEFKC